MDLCNFWWWKTSVEKAGTPWWLCCAYICQTTRYRWIRLRCRTTWTGCWRSWWKRSRIQRLTEWTELLVHVWSTCCSIVFLTRCIPSRGQMYVVNVNCLFTYLTILSYFTSDFTDASHWCEHWCIELSTDERSKTTPWWIICLYVRGMFSVDNFLD